MPEDQAEGVIVFVVAKNAVLVVARYAVVVVLCLTPFSPGVVRAEEGPDGRVASLFDDVEKGEPQQRSSWSNLVFEPFPDKPLYAPYLADPERIAFGLQILYFSKTRIPKSGNLRFDLKSGGEFGLVRLHPAGDDDRGVQLSLQAGFHSQFDIRHQLDNIGWDGHYGFVLEAAQSKNLSFRVGYLHDSSHVGDEYAERIGRLRIGYTREEVALGVSWLSDNGWRTYAEYGLGQVMRSEFQKPGRVQFGFEWQPAKPVRGLYRGWYGAADVTAMQERDWKMDVSVQTGYRIDTPSKSWRFGLDLYNGRSPIGEFFQHTESYLGFGIWVDI